MVSGGESIQLFTKAKLLILDADKIYFQVKVLILLLCTSKNKAVQVLKCIHFFFLKKQV